MAVDLGYANARVRARKSYLFPRSFFEKLIQATDVDEAISILSQTRYKEDLERGMYRAPGVGGAEEGLKNYFLKTVRELYNWVDPYTRRLLEIAMGRWDVYNLKSILRGKHFGASEEEILESLLPAGGLSQTLLRELVRQPDIKATIDMLATWRSPLASPLTQGFPEFAKSGNLASLELQLDKYYYKYALGKLKQKNLNVQLVREIIRREIDFTNLMSSIKATKEGLETEEIKALFIEGGKNVSKAMFEQMAALTSPEEIVSYLERTPFQEALKAGLEDYFKTGFVSAIERRIEDFVVRKAVALFRADPLSIAIILAFIWGLFNEVVNLRIILRGKAVMMKEEKIREALVFV